MSEPDKKELSKSQNEFIIEEVFKPAGVTVLPTKEYKLPNEYDVSAFPEDDQEFIKKSITKITDYLQTPIITDKFKTDKERDNWQYTTYDKLNKEHGKETAEKFKKLLNSNKLKRSSLNVVLGYVDFLRENVPQDLLKTFEDKIKETNPSPEGFDPWEDTPTSQKVEKIEEISNITVNILNSLARK